MDDDRRRSDRARDRRKVADGVGVGGDVRCRVVYSFRDDLGMVAQRLKSEATGAPVVAGQEMRIPMAIDGHFWVEASLNGVPVKFLVDSGATMTTIGRKAAADAGVDVGANRDQLVRTGNGMVRFASGRARPCVGRSSAPMSCCNRRRRGFECAGHELSVVARALGGRGALADPQGVVGWSLFPISSIALHNTYYHTGIIARERAPQSPLTEEKRRHEP